MSVARANLVTVELLFKKKKQIAPSAARRTDGKRTKETPFEQLRISPHAISFWRLQSEPLGNQHYLRSGARWEGWLFNLEELLRSGGERVREQETLGSRDQHWHSQGGLTLPTPIWPTVLRPGIHYWGGGAADLIGRLQFGPQCLFKKVEGGRLGIWSTLPTKPIPTTHAFVL